MKIGWMVGKLAGAEPFSRDTVNVLLQPIKESQINPLYNDLCKCLHHCSMMFCTSVHKCDSVCGVLMPAHWMAVAYTHGSFQRDSEQQLTSVQIKSITCHTNLKPIQLKCRSAEIMSAIYSILAINCRRYRELIICQLLSTK